MQFLALISGGKDSLYSIMECQKQGHTLVACLHLGRPTVEQEESFMYQTAASEVMHTLVEECLQVPYIHYQRKGLSVNTQLAYEETLNDEVEDLYDAIDSALLQFPHIQAVSSGAILSHYQRLRVESVCQRLNLTSLAYLWRLGSQHQVLENIIDDGVDAILVKVAAPPGLQPRRHLGQSLSTLQPHFQTLHKKYQFHVCGEGGEYESLVVDCPLYHKKLVIDDSEILQEDDGVGTLRIHKCHAEPKSESMVRPDILSAGAKEKSVTAQPDNLQSLPTPSPIRLARVRQMEGGFWHVSGISSPLEHQDWNETECAVYQARAIFQILQATLAQYGCRATDVTFVHLYLSEIAHFAAINRHYQEVFGALLPPARSCVAVGKMTGGRRVSLDCTVLPQSGAFLRGAKDGNPNFAPRHVLHVQSISHWAPVCIGPYSQANTLWECLHQVAGQIGLIPASMKLPSNMSQQLNQAWTNVAAILDGLNNGSDARSSLPTNLISCVVYVAANELEWNAECLGTIQDISMNQIRSNAGIVAGAVDNIAGVSTGDDYGGFEDRETMLALLGDDAAEDSPEEEAIPPILILAVPELPIGALTEVEVLAATQKAISSLELETSSARSSSCNQLMGNGTIRSWDSSGYHSLQKDQVQAYQTFSINSHVTSMGFGSLACGLVSAYADPDNDQQQKQNSTIVSQLSLFSKMIECLMSAGSRAGTSIKDMLHVRLFYCSDHDVDEVGLRSELDVALASRLPDEQCPAATIVPVQNMAILFPRVESSVGALEDTHDVMFAMQVLFINPARLETELWVHYGREG